MGADLHPPPPLTLKLCFKGLLLPGSVSLWVPFLSVCLSDSLTRRPSRRAGTSSACALLCPGTQEGARHLVGEQSVGAERIHRQKEHFLHARPCTKHSGSSVREAYSSRGSHCLPCPRLAQGLGKATSLLRGCSCVCNTGRRPLCEFSEKPPESPFL